MAGFTPRQEKKKTNTTGQRVFPTPKRAGARPARISVIVDLGVQPRKDFEDPKTGEIKPQKPVQQVAIFADLVRDVVDYGPEVGEKPYRLMLNKNFRGEIEGISFQTVPQRDANGKMLDREWIFHPASVLTKLANATDTKEIITPGKHNADISRLLGKPLYITIDITENEGKKALPDGTKPIFRNVKVKGFSQVPWDDEKDAPMTVPEMHPDAPPVLISFNQVTPESFRFLRRDVLAMMQTAPEYAGSHLEKLVKAAEEAESDAAASEPMEKSEKAPALGEDDDAPY